MYYAIFKTDMSKRITQTSNFFDYSPEAARTAATSDIDEVALIKAFRPSVARIGRKHPLVDVVTPQPDAFFAYLRMPAAQTANGKKAVKRVSRKKLGSK